MFKNKYRSISFGAVCLVAIIALAVSVNFIALQSDNSSAESDSDYSLNGGIYTNYESDDLGEIIGLINGDSTGSVFTITVNNNIPDFAGYTLDVNKTITLTSSPGDTHKLTMASAERHFTVKGGTTLVLMDIILEGGNSTGFSGGIEVESAGTLIMELGAVIQKCSARDGGGVYNNGTFTMKGGDIKDNNALGNIGGPGGGYGGGVFNYESATFVMEAGKISGNNARLYGGGVENYGTFTMDRGTITGNSVPSEGAGVHNHGTFTMNGGEITGHNAIIGAGLCSYGTFIMNGGEISGNSAKDAAGVLNYRNFYMNGGEISGNTAITFGGGVVNEGSSGAAPAVFTMTGGKIINNTAFLGGGVSNSSIELITKEPAVFNMTGGEISGNKALSPGANPSYGGGVSN